MISREAILHRQVCDYIRYRYPTALFRTDFAAGIKMTIGQAQTHKRLQHGRAWPDLFIAEPRYSKDTKDMYSGLFIELKATNIYKKDGTLLANPHVQEQHEVLSQLAARGYKAVFAVGFEEAKKHIDAYLR